jgi:hypothetical protein
MYVLGKCKKCGEVTTFDFTDLTVEKAKDVLATTEMGECPGMHVEIGPWSNYYNIDWDNLYNSKEEAIAAKNSIQL